MTPDGAKPGSTNERSIIDTVIADITLRRAVPDVFLLDETGRATAWPIGTSKGMPRSMQPLIDMYFAQDAPHRGPLTELVAIDGVQMCVRIIPYHSDAPSVYAVIVEPFVVRSRRAQSSGELTTS